MSGLSTIEWTDVTWNPVTGCSKVSPGCAHCYAEGIARRFAGRAGNPTWKPWTPANASHNVVLRPDRLDDPLRWRKPRMVFVNSMSDLFHDEVPDEFIRDVFDVMHRARRHTFQVLTKRPERMRELLTRWASECEHGPGRAPMGDECWWCAPAPNVWLGVSIENDRHCFRADFLRATPAAVRFISAEPLLGPLDSLSLHGIDWLIVGGESGTGARPMHPDWVRQLRDRCHADDPEGCYCPDRDAFECAGSCHTAFFFKQWGAWAPWGRLLGEESGQWDTFVNPDGATGSVAGDADVITNWAGPFGEQSQIVSRVGKTAAGRVLDARTYDEMPEVSHA